MHEKSITTDVAATFGMIGPQVPFSSICQSHIPRSNIGRITEATFFLDTNKPNLTKDGQNLFFSFLVDIVLEPHYGAQEIPVLRSIAQSQASRHQTENASTFA